MSFIQGLRSRAQRLRRETYVLYLAVRDPRTPWYAKVLAGAVVAYALSPIDLIPDFIPILGYVDDLILVPLGIAAVLRLVPAPVMEDCRRRAEAAQARPVSRAGAAIVIGVWLFIAMLLLWRLLWSP